MKTLPFYAFPIACLFISCTERTQNQTTAQSYIPTIEHSGDTLVLATKFTKNTLIGNFDLDTQKDSAFLMLNTNNNLHAIKIKYSNGKIDIIGGGIEIAGQEGLNDAGLGRFEIAPKGEIYFDNLDEKGEFLNDEQIEKVDKITLQCDGILIHYEESCGGGIIYNDNGTYKWIIQE